MHEYFTSINDINLLPQRSHIFIQSRALLHNWRTEVCAELTWQWLLIRDRWTYNKTRWSQTHSRFRNTRVFLASPELTQMCKTRVKCWKLKN